MSAACYWSTSRWKTPTRWLLHVWNGRGRGPWLHNRRRQSEITALCRLWLCVVAALDKTNDGWRNAELAPDRWPIFTGPEPIRFTQIGPDPESVPRSVRSLIIKQYLDSCRISPLPLAITSFTDAILRLLNLINDVLTFTVHRQYTHSNIKQASKHTTKIYKVESNSWKALQNSRNPVLINFIYG